MNIVNVPGERKQNKVLLYTLSTCAWCKRTKGFLKDNGIDYGYVDIDFCSDSDRRKIRKEIEKLGGELVYPSIIIDDKILISGFVLDKIKETLGI